MSNPLNMTQADTGKWYAYVASESAVVLAANEAYFGFPDHKGDPRAFLSDITLATGKYDLCNSRQSDFTDDSDIVIKFGDETITLHYEEDLDDLATVSTDRDRVPIGGQVHVTVSDFRLNLDPTGEDKWVMNADGNWHHS